MLRVRTHVNAKDVRKVNVQSKEIIEHIPVKTKKRCPVCGDTVAKDVVCCDESDDHKQNEQWYEEDDARDYYDERSY